MTNGILSNVEAWTGARPLTCPWRAFSEPIVRRALTAFDYYDKGQLAVYEPDASNRLIEAVSYYARASAKVHSKRLRMEREEAQRKREAVGHHHG